MIVWPWVGFFAIVLLVLAPDLFGHRRSTIQSSLEATGWTVFWIILALIFNVGIYYVYEHRLLAEGLAPRVGLSGTQAALQFLTGYLLEKSLSLDNILVIALIFSHLRVGAAEQNRLLFWGVLGALVLRALMLSLGLTLIEHFTWMVYVFGILLIFTAVKMLIVRHDNLEPERNPLVRLSRRYVDFTPELDGPHLFTRVEGRRVATPLFVALLMIASADVLFAVDSVPAILAITRDPFLVFTSNVFAVLGLRSLYFMLASVMRRLGYLKVSLVFLLAFVAAKMLLSQHHPVPTAVSLVVIVTTLAVGIAASIAGGHRDTAPLVSPLADDLAELARVSYRKARRVVVLIIGSTLLLTGSALLVLPGPGIPVVLLALTLLATEFVWARHMLGRARSQTERLVRSTRRLLGSSDPEG